MKDLKILSEWSGNRQLGLQLSSYSMESTDILLERSVAAFRFKLRKSTQQIMPSNLNLQKQIKLIIY
jgi:hypothetical protein